jgi:hypothetical protein
MATVANSCARRFIEDSLLSAFRNYTHSEPRFRALLTGGALEIKLALV